MALASAQSRWQPSDNIKWRMAWWLEVWGRKNAETWTKRSPRDGFFLSGNPVASQEEASFSLLTWFLSVPLPECKVCKAHHLSRFLSPPLPIWLCPLNSLTSYVWTLILMDPCWTYCSFPETLFLLFEHGCRKHCHPSQPASYVASSPYRFSVPVILHSCL